MSKPSVFIGSSSGFTDIGVEIGKALEDVAFADLWNHSALPLTHTIFDGLLTKAQRADFGVFVFVPEDLVEREGQQYFAIRDNVLFEFGLFLGVLGRNRTFAIMPKDSGGHVPVDLSGVLLATYDAGNPNRASAVALACSGIHAQIKKRRFRRRATGRVFRNLSSASNAILRTIEESPVRRLAVLAATAGAVVPDVLEQKLRSGALDLTVHLVNPDHPLKDALPPHWPGASSQSLRMLAYMVERHKEWKVDCWLYDHIPCVHGFMIDSQHLFIGYYRWQGRDLVGAQAPYRYYRRSADTEDHFVLFESWLSAPTARHVALPAIQ